MKHKRTQLFCLWVCLVFLCCQWHNSHLFQRGTQLGLAFSNTSPSWSVSSTKHKACWLPSFCINPPNQLTQCINLVLEQVFLVGFSKSSPRQSFSSLGWTASYLLRDIQVPDLKNPGASKPMAEPTPDPTWRSCEIWFEISVNAFLHSHRFATFEFLIRTSPNSPSNLWST